MKALRKVNNLPCLCRDATMRGHSIIIILSFISFSMFSSFSTPVFDDDDDENDVMCATC